MDRNKIKLFSMFSGYGGAEFALKKSNISYEVVGFSEIDKYAVQIYKQNHGDIKNYGDATKINPEDIPDFDLLTGGFPCSPKGTLIKTKKGFKEIENITNKDYVLTHKNRYEKVVITMNKISNHINKIKALGCYSLNLTDEHPIYIYENKEFKWREVKNLKKGNYLTYNINNKSTNKLNLNETECWLLGRYCADGSIEKYRNRLYFSIGSHKREEFENYIKNYNYYFCHENRNCQEFYVNNIRLLNLCKLFKTGSKNKEIPQEIVDLSNNLLQKFFEGYISGDGHYDTNGRKRLMFSTVSEKMMLSLQEIVIKLYKKVPSISVRKDNRKESYNNSYFAQIHMTEFTQRDSFIVEDKICSKIKSIKREEKNIEVYNFEVEKDNSYCCNNVITHNCQAFSIAGNRKGFTDTRGTLFNDIVRILEVKKPKYFLLENVEGLLSHDKGRTFKIIMNALKETGYYVKWKLLNSKHYGTPQSRSRIFIVGFLHKEDFDLFWFPKKKKLNYELKDLLEKEVDNKYYLTEKQIYSMKNRNRYGDYLIDDINKEKVHKCLCAIGSSDVGVFDVSKTLTAGGRNCGNNFIVGDYRYDEGFRPRKDRSSPTLCASMRDNSISGGIPLVNPNNKFRRLTPKECFRLMGFYNDEIDLSNISNSQLYKLAGNGWEINVVSKIFYEMFKNKTKKELDKWF